MSVTNTAIRLVRVATYALALCLVVTGCDTSCWDECRWDTWRCDGKYVQYCTMSYVQECDGPQNQWELRDTCGSGERCTTDGCDKRGACCVAAQ